MSKRSQTRLQPLSNDLEGAPGSSLQAIKVQQRAREDDEKARLRRVKGAIVLILQFLLDQGYTGTLKMLQQESRLTLQQFCPADNVDILSIIMEYENYFEFRFNRRPKLFRAASGGRNATADEQSGDGIVLQRSYTSSEGFRKRQTPGNHFLQNVPNYVNAAQMGEALLSNVNDTQRPRGRSPTLARGLALAQKPSPPSSPRSAPLIKLKRTSVAFNGVEGLRVEPVSSTQSANIQPGTCNNDEFFGRALKPLPRFPSNDLQELAMVIQHDILDVNPNVRWSDIAALDQAKQLLKEAVVMPVKYPELFAGIVRPWKGILLFGPPGTGKTLLAKAVATECRTTFFNISASSVVSKWRGESEKLVRLLFDLAVHYAPSTIFIDEIDSLMSSRSGDAGHEGSRRMKTELLIQMDGLSKRQGGEVVFVLAASNVPWDLDTAMLRRLEKRILVGLPTHEARVKMFRHILSPAAESPDMDWNMCANLTNGMSGADIDVLCREAMMRPIRLMIDKLESAGNPAELKDGSLKRPRVTIEDVKAGAACTQSSVRQLDLEKCEEWARKHGSSASS